MELVQSENSYRVRILVIKSLFVQSEFVQSEGRTKRGIAVIAISSCRHLLGQPLVIGHSLRLSKQSVTLSNGLQRFQPT